MTSENLKTGPLEPFLAAFGVWPDQPPMRIHGGGRSEVHRLEHGGNSYALRILHATIDREGIRYVQRVTDHLSRSLPEVPTLIPTTSGFPYAESDGWLATLSNWLPGTHPSADGPWLLEASAALLARLHRTALDLSVKAPRPDRPTYQSLDWKKNYLFNTDTVRIILFEDSSPLYETSREEDWEVVTEILSRKSFIMEQTDIWSKWSKNPGGIGRSLLRAPIHGDIYAANLLSENNESRRSSIGTSASSSRWSTSSAVCSGNSQRTAGPTLLKRESDNDSWQATGGPEVPCRRKSWNC